MHRQDLQDIFHIRHGYVLVHADRLGSLKCKRYIMKKAKDVDKSMQVGCFWLFVMLAIVVGFILCAKMDEALKEDRELERIEHVEERERTCKCLVEGESRDRECGELI